MYIKSKKIYTEDGIIDGYLKVEDGKFVDIISGENGITADIDATDNIIIPGIIDTHNHGTMGYGLMGKESTEENIRGYLKGLASQGVTACLPTANVDCFHAIVQCAQGTVDGAIPIGIHSEGPYLNRVGEKGIDTGHPDIEIEVLDKLISESKGMLKLVAIAPELPGAKEAIEYLTNKGVRCAFAHSNMMYDEAIDSFGWGISVITHTANVMSGIHHRNMGGLGAALLDDNVYNELICDGLHVSNEMIEMIFRIKKNAFDKIMMVSDNVPMAGAPVGRYALDGMFEVNIDAQGYCLSDTGRLCGSTLPVLAGMKNLVNNLGVKLEDVIKMAALNPANVYNVPTKGSIAQGKSADFVIIDNDFNVIKTVSEGRIVYDSDKDKAIFNPQFLEMITAK